MARRDDAEAGRVEQVRALLHPGNVVILGATDKPGNWAMRSWRNVARYKFAGGIFPMNPQRAEIWGTRCYRSFAELPETPDHIVVVIPARFVPQALRDAAKAGARSATVFSSGFGESSDPASTRLAAELEAAIAETGLAVSGPNCLGNMSAPGSLMTMTDDRPQRNAEGPVAIVGQSGGIAMSIKRTLEERGIDTRFLVTSGNEAGLTSADYISFFAEAPGVKVIVSYLEGIRGDPRRFLAACRKARAAGRPVVVLKLGGSEAGRAAALAHTGALAGSMQAFDAVAGEAGALRMRNTDDVVEAVEYLVHCPLPKGARGGAITLSGGMRGLLLDAGHEHGMPFGGLSDATRARLDRILGVGSIVGNPLDAGFAALTNPKALFQSVEALVADPDIDVLLVQEELPRGPGTERKEANMRTINELALEAGKPVAFVSMISHGLTDYSRQFRAGVGNVAFLQECDKSMRVLSAIARHAAALRAEAPRAHSAPTAGEAAALERLAAWTGPATLDEVTSKALLEAYGIAGPREEVARSREEAAAIARRLGGWVVAKVVSAALPHKSDIGGVIVGLDGPAAAAAAYERIEAAVARLPNAPRLDGVLIAEMVSGGIEVVLGAEHDPEMGPVILFGSGGVDIELERDVALAAPPLDEARALALIARTKAGKRLAGTRGRAALDRAAVAAALVGLSRLMTHAGGLIQSIDVNPFLAREAGGVALDGLIVRRASAGKSSPA